MSQENVERVRAVHDGWARRFRVAQSCSRRISPGTSPHEAVEPGSRRGPEVRDALRNLFDVYDDYRVEASEFIDGGNAVVVVARSKGTAKASRMELDQLFAFVWTVQGGRLARLRVFTDREQALAAAGLRE